MNAILIALAAGIPSFLLGFLAYRRSVKVDAVAAQVSVSTDSRAGTQQIIEGLNSLVENLQEDNKALRDEARYLLQRISNLTEETNKLKAELDIFRKKYEETS